MLYKILKGIALLSFSLVSFGCSEKVNYVVFQAIQWKATPAYTVAKAIENGNFKKVRDASETVLLSEEPTYERNLLMLAIMHHQYDIAAYIVERVGLVNSKERYYGTTPLILACGLQEINLDFIKFLVDNGADVNLQESGALAENHHIRQSPLSAAVQANHLELINYLIQKGSDVNQPYSESGRTPLTLALLSKNKVPIAKTLILAGADIDNELYRTIDGKPVYILEALRNIVGASWKYRSQSKDELIKLLQHRGYDYFNEPVPDWTLKKLQKAHPTDWENYLNTY